MQQGGDISIEVDQKNYKAEEIHNKSSKLFRKVTQNSTMSRKTQRQITLGSVERIKATQSLSCSSFINKTLHQSKQEKDIEGKRVQNLQKKKNHYQFIPKKSRKSQQEDLFIAREKKKLQQLTTNVKSILDQLTRTLSSLNEYIQFQLQKQIHNLLTQISIKTTLSPAKIKASHQLTANTQVSEQPFYPKPISQFNQYCNSGTQNKKGQLFEQVVNDYIKSIKMITGKLLSKEKNKNGDDFNEKWAQQHLKVPSIQKDKFLFRSLNEE